LIWALRQIGKRSLQLNKEAVKASRDIQKIPSASARWIASDAIRELTRPDSKEISEEIGTMSN
jgi:3-methyladenine DNA glycosylase AlkD